MKSAALIIIVGGLLSGCNIPGIDDVFKTDYTVKNPSAAQVQTDAPAVQADVVINNTGNGSVTYSPGR